MNTSSTKVDLRCDVDELDAPASVKERIAAALGPVVRVGSSQERSQRRNRGRALERLCEMLDDAAEVATPRRATRPSRASVERRLAEKRHHASRKADRRWSAE